MEKCYVLVIICVILSANCENHNGQAIKVDSHKESNEMPVTTKCADPSRVNIYILMLCILGAAVAIMLCAIIYLVLALLRMKRKLYINNDRTQFLREETSWQNCENVSMRDKYRNNESTLTINSGDIEVNRYSEPETPTRDHEIKIYVTKPTGKVPLMHKKQMEEIIQHVLNRSKKTASTSLRELNELQNEVNDIPILGTSHNTKELSKEAFFNDENDLKINEVTTINPKENDKVYDIETDEQAKDVNNEKPTEEVPTNTNEETKKVDAKNEIIIEEVVRPASVLEMEVYDTVPTPIRTSSVADDTDSFPLYDCPPSDNKPYDNEPNDNNGIYECPPSDKSLIYDCSITPSNKMLLVDPETDYIMPLTRRDTNTYINARTPRK